MSVIADPSQFIRQASFEERRKLRSKREYIVDTILPSFTAHLLIGASGAGKTRWLLKQMYEWEKGEPVLGYASHPVPWIYISCDRQLDEISKTLESLGLGDWKIPAVTMGQFRKSGFVPTLEYFLKEFNWAKFFVFEGFDRIQKYSYLPKEAHQQNRYADSMDVWGKMAEDYGTDYKSVLAVRHPPKEKGSDKYIFGRDKVQGSGGIPGVIGTVISMEMESDTSVNRTISVHPRERSSFVIPVMFNDRGEVIERSPNSIRDAVTNVSQPDKLLQKLMGVGTELVIPTNVFRAWANELGISKATLFRWINDMEEAGLLKSVAHGSYQRTDEQ